MQGSRYNGHARVLITKNISESNILVMFVNKDVCYNVCNFKKWKPQSNMI